MFWMRGLIVKGVNFWRLGSGFLEVTIINFTSRLLLDLLIAYFRRKVYKINTSEY